MGGSRPRSIDARIGAQRRTALPAPPAGVAVVPLHGVIMPKASMMSDVSGGTSIERFRAQFRQSMASPRRIWRRSGRGFARWDGRRRARDGRRDSALPRGTKPIVAVANTQASSAGYWLASQADELVASKSARLGSVGVFAAHEDESAKAESEGVKTTLIAGGVSQDRGQPVRATLR